jgi:[acyl-carrier-protein] S-malonyltransferase
MEKTGLIFPGQGTQVVGMGRSLVEHYETTAELFREANTVLGYDLGKLCFEGPLEQLTESRYCQSALFMHQFAAACVLQELVGKNQFELAMGLSMAK